MNFSRNLIKKKGYFPSHCLWASLGDLELRTVESVRLLQKGKQEGDAETQSMCSRHQQQSMVLCSGGCTPANTCAQCCAATCSLKHTYGWMSAPRLIANPFWLTLRVTPHSVTSEELFRPVWSDPVSDSHLASTSCSQMHLKIAHTLCLAQLIKKQSYPASSSNFNQFCLFILQAFQDMDSFSLCAREACKTAGLWSCV